MRKLSLAALIGAAVAWFAYQAVQIAGLAGAHYQASGWAGLQNFFERVLLWDWQLSVTAAAPGLALLAIAWLFRPRKH